MEENVNRELYDTFGVSDYHKRNIFGNNVSIYIIDTGIQINPDLANVIVEDFSGTLGSTSSHGSAVASLISAPRNDFGIIGIAPEATVYLADVDDSNSNIWDSYVAQALYSAYLRNVDIISISLSTPVPSSLLHNAIQLCVDAGILVFAAAGNSGKVQYEYPASFPGVISVASCTPQKQWSAFNTKNDRISVVAPGEHWKLPTQNGYAYFNGTSFACPFAAAMAALDLSERRPRNELLPKARIIQELNFTMKTTLLVPQSMSSTFGAASLIFLGLVAVVFLVGILYANKKSNIKVS
jgi:minor extracellular protease Epr